MVIWAMFKIGYQMCEGVGSLMFNLRGLEHVLEPGFSIWIAEIRSLQSEGIELIRDYVDGC